MNYRILLLLLLGLVSACAGQRRSQASAQEAHRPAFHFTPENMWMNDPNGMVWYEGEYHLFYQYHPYSTVWGPMHWGHAVSRDLVHWQHLPIALYPDSLGMIFSGSAVIDWNNTSGFGEKGRPPMVAVFTQHDMAGEKAGRQDFQTQGIAYSTDRGRSWTKYTGNPVIPNPGIRDFRDPKVVRDEASGQWVLVMAAGDHVRLYGSKDLRKWQYLSDFGREWGAHGGVWECPDLFPMQVEGTGEKKWVLLQSLNPGSPNGGSGTQYFVGNFDGRQFTLDPDFAASLKKNDRAFWVDYGRDNYAGVTWSDVPASDGRRIFLGWMSNWDYAQTVPTKRWRSAMTLPRELTLQRGPEGLRLYARPAREVAKLRKRHVELAAQTLLPTLDLTPKLGFSPCTSELLLEFEQPAAGTTDLAVVLANTKGERYRVGYDALKNEWYSDRRQAGDSSFSYAFATQRHVAPRSPNTRTVQLHLFFDRASCELFADGGAVALTDIFFPAEDFSRLSIETEGGSIRLLKGEVWELKP
ncbi:MAG: glycoside hydrolase family 32 protein [Saprospiraceae bacterium]